MRTQITDIVVLIPGFMGFDKLGRHSYFADTVAEAIISALERAGRPRGTIAVEPVSVSPADTLAQRQQDLLRELKRVTGQYGTDVRLHLVGHSTGGVDAELLTLRQGQAKYAWRPDDDTRVRNAIRSIVTIASPLAGTTLAASPIATWAGADSLSEVWTVIQSKVALTAVVPVLKVLQALLQLRDDRSAVDVLYGVFDGTPRLSKFVSSVALRRSLISDLVPSHVTEVLAKEPDPRLASVRRARFLTVAPKSKKKSQAGQLYDLFYTFTENEADRKQVPAFLGALKERIDKKLVESIAGDPALLADLVRWLDPASNDAIVNTLRQLVATTAPGQLAVELERVIAIVLADHLDVVGYFPSNRVIDRGVASWFRSGKTTQNGFLESGSHFGEAQLQRLYELVAEEIRESIVESPSPTTTRIEA